MSTNGRKITYTAADFEQYYNGEMPAAERHALEKAALDDPFLADALEGYAHTKSPVADVVFLKQQLQKKQSKFIPVFWMQPQNYLKVAAMLVLLVGFGWLTYQLSYSNKSNIALLRNDTIEKNQKVSEKAAIDSEAIKPAETLQTETSDQIMAKRKAKKEALSERNANASDQTFSKAHNDAFPDEKTVRAARRAPEAFKVRVAHPNGNAVTEARISNPQQKALDATDSAGSYLVQLPDSSSSIAKNSTVIQQQKAVLNPSQRETASVLQPVNPTIATNKKLTAQNRIRLEGALPLNGWPPVDLYLDSSQFLVNQIPDKTGVTEVVVSFDVAADRSAVNIRIDKPLCTACDAAAVGIIANSTRWKTTIPGKRAKAFIRF